MPGGDVVNPGRKSRATAIPSCAGASCRNSVTTPSKEGFAQPAVHLALMIVVGTTVGGMTPTRHTEALMLSWA